MKDKRKYFRLKEQDSINYTIIPNYKSERMVTQDIGQGGIRFICRHFIGPESIVKLGLEFARTKRSIAATARVKWIKTIYDDERYEIGAEFIDIAPQDLLFLSQYLGKKY